MMPVKPKGNTNDPRHALARLVEDMRVLVCVGSGGVGKTTTAASLGLYGAMLGKRTLVITIDPARRLANSLGIEELLHRPKTLDTERLARAGISVAAPMDAMMLDLKAAWDDMVRRSCENADDAERIMQNRFYGYLSSELPGAQEFIACEALHTLSEEHGYDLVVLDTPPTANALDFLTAPQKVLSFLDNDALRLLTKDRTAVPGAAKLGMRFLDGAAGAATSILSRFTGAQLLEELGAFLLLLRSIYGPLVERTRGFESRLKSHLTRFVVVTSPAPGPLREARYFSELLQEYGLQIGSTIINRVTPPPEPGLGDMSPQELQTHIQDVIPDCQVTQTDAQSVFEAIDQQVRAAQRDRDAIQSTEAWLPADLPRIEVPLMHGDVHDASRLRELLPWLVGEV